MKVCSNCGLPAGGEGEKHWMLPDGWGWNEDRSIVCPTCLRLGVHADEVAERGVN